jgi:hypothetical protein
LAVTAAESVATWARLPDLPANLPSSLVVSRSALETTLRFRPGSGPVEIRLPLETVFAGGAMRSVANGLPPPAASLAFGAGAAVSFDVGGGAYLGFLVDGMLLSTASPFLVMSPDDGSPGSYSTGQDDLLIGLGRLAVLAGWHDERWRLFGTVTLRNQPALDVERSRTYPEEETAGIDGGPAFLIWTLGLDVAVLSWLSLHLLVHQPVCVESSVFAYAPIVTGGIDVFVP